MRVYRRDKRKVLVPALDGAARRREVEADVLAMWIVASRLLGRLTESGQPSLSRKARPRGRSLRAMKTEATRSALIP